MRDEILINVLTFSSYILFHKGAAKIFWAIAEMKEHYVGLVLIRTSVKNLSEVYLKSKHKDSQD